MCAPKCACGLGLPNLQWLNVAIQARWPWLQRTDQSRSWSEFQFEVPEESRQLFRAATRSVLGNGMLTNFWEDQWLEEYRIQNVALSMYAMVTPRVRASRTVCQAISTGDWALDIGPDLTVQQLNEYMNPMAPGDQNYPGAGGGRLHYLALGGQRGLLYE